MRRPTGNVKLVRESTGSAKEASASRPAVSETSVHQGERVAPRRRRERTDPHGSETAEEHTSNQKRGRRALAGRRRARCAHELEIHLPAGPGGPHDHPRAEGTSRSRHRKPTPLPGALRKGSIQSRSMAAAGQVRASFLARGDIPRGRFDRIRTDPGSRGTAGAGPTPSIGCPERRP